MQNSLKISPHAVAQWRRRAPKFMRSTANLKLAVQAGVVLRKNLRGQQYLRALGMILVVDRRLVVTCFRVKPHHWTSRPLADFRRIRPYPAHKHCTASHQSAS